MTEKKDPPKKPKYKKPTLIDFSSATAAGTPVTKCGLGSGATGNCQDGITPASNCNVGTGKV